MPLDYIHHPQTLNSFHAFRPPLSTIRSHPNPPVLPPRPHPVINLCFRDPIPDQPHCHTQLLDVTIPALVIEKQHILKSNPALFLYFLEMSFLVPWENLHIIENI